MGQGMQTLGAVAEGRDNNFNLIRMLAATAVLVSHAWPIALGPQVPEPLEALFGRALGGMAVVVFFVLSGFLITASYARLAAPGPFVLARGLRLFPGLVVSLVLVSLVMGPWVSTLTPQAYWTDPGTWRFLAHDITLASPVYTLPGVFARNPYATVEGSIWTLIHEVACYGGVLLAGMLGLIRRRVALSLGLLLVYGAFWLLPGLGLVTLPPRLEAFRGLSLGFVAGMVLWLWRDRIALPVLGLAGLAGLAAAVAGVASGVASGGMPGALADLALVTGLAGATFWLAFVPGRGWLRGIRAYNRIGDYSYGLYIYAFPLQGLAVWLWGPLTPWQNIALALPLTLALAVPSWHLIEAPALRLRRRVPAARILQA